MSMDSLKKKSQCGGVAKPDGDRGGKGYLCKMKCSKPSALPVGTHGGKEEDKRVTKISQP